MTETKGTGSKVPASKKVTETIKPWSKEPTWWVLAGEAVITIGLGIYVILQSAQATIWMAYALAIFLLVDGLLAVFNGMRGHGKTFGSMRGGVGLLAGAVLLLMPVFNYGSPTMAGWLIGLALIISGIAGLLSRFFEMPRPIRWMGVLINLLMIVLGFVYIDTVIQQDATVLYAVGWLLLAVGAALAVYAFVIWNEGRRKRA